MTTQLRQELGDFSSVVCLKYMIEGMEDALGEKATAIALIAAGRKRGQQLALDLNLNGQIDALKDLAGLAQKLDQAVGKAGTRLCCIDKIVQENEAFKVYTRDTVCSSGEPQGSPRQCTFTLGAVQGVLESITGQRFRGKHTESVLRGGTHDVLEYARLN